MPGSKSLVRQPSFGLTDTIYHTVAPYNLNVANGKRIFIGSVKGKIYVTDFFFATCQTICPKMNMQMKRVQEAYKDDPEISLVSFTVNPEKNTVEALAAMPSNTEQYRENGFSLQEIKNRFMIWHATAFL